MGDARRARVSYGRRVGLGVGSERVRRLVLTALAGAAAITLVAAVTSAAPAGVLAVLGLVSLLVLALLLTLGELGARRTRARVSGVADPTTAVRLTRDVERGRVPLDRAWWPPAVRWAEHLVAPRTEDRVAVVVVAVLVVVELYGAISSGDARSFVLPAVLVLLAGGAHLTRRRTREHGADVLEAIRGATPHTGTDATLPS